MPDIPADLQQALRAVPNAQARFTALPPSHKAEYLNWIEQAKKPETRARRIAGTIERLSDPAGAAASRLLTAGAHG